VVLKKTIHTRLEKPTFRETFVINSHRERLFNVYLDFVEELQKLPIEHFYQWIDGSFTTKSAFPRDIDLVNFVDSTFYRRFESRLVLLSQQYKMRGLDIYCVAIFPENNFKHAITVYRTHEYLELYGSDRLDMKTRLVNELVELLREMNIYVELKAAA
jgi:hypothetical protein